MSKKRIGFDLDGTLYNWHYAVYTELLVHENLPFTFEEFWSYGWKDYRTPFYWDNLCQYRHLIGNQPPAHGLVDMIKEIAKEYDTYYISHRPHDIFHTTLAYLKRHDFPQYKNLIFTKDKKDYVKKLNIEIYVDDRVSVTEDLKDVCKVFLVTQPYNRNVEIDYTRLDSILDLKEYVL